MTDVTSRPTMSQTPTSPPPPRPRRHKAAFVLVALGAIVASMLAVWHFTQSDGTEAPVELEAIFDFEEDSLCDWFTAAQMDGVVTEAMARADVDIDVESFSNGGSCWVTSASNAGAIWGTPGWQTQSDGGLGITLAPVANDLRAVQYRSTEPARFEHHPVLDDAVAYGNFTQIGFAYARGAMGQLLVEGHEDEVLFLGVGVEGSTLDQTTITTAQQLDFALSVADVMLEQMGWID